MKKKKGWTLNLTKNLFTRSRIKGIVDDDYMLDGQEASQCHVMWSKLESHCSGNRESLLFSKEVIFYSKKKLTLSYKTTIVTKGGVFYWLLF